MRPPDEAINEALRLTRRARRASGDEEAACYRARRDDLLSSWEYVAREREEGGALGRGQSPDGQATSTHATTARGGRAILVCYPAEWVVEGTVVPDRIDDTGRAIERPISGPGAEDDWDTVEDHNRAVADRIEAEHGPIHGANAHAFADFMGNHYARRVETATDEEVTEFLDEYFPRNAWPTDEQRACVERSIDLLRDG